MENIFPIFKQYLRLHNIRQLQLISTIAETFDISLYLLNKVLKDINHRLLKQIYHLSIIIQDNFVFSKHILFPTLNLHFNKLKYKVPRDVCNHLEFLFCLFDSPNNGLYKLLMLNFLQYFNIDLCNFTTEYDIFSTNCVNEFRKRKKIRYYCISVIVILSQKPELYSLLSYLYKLDEYSEIVANYKQFLKYLWYFNVRDMFNRYYIVLKNLKENKLNEYPKIQTPNIASVLCTSSAISSHPSFFHVSPIKPLKPPPQSPQQQQLLSPPQPPSSSSSSSLIVSDMLKLKIVNHMYDDSSNNDSLSLTPIKNETPSVSMDNSNSVDSIELISIIEPSKSSSPSKHLSSPPLHPVISSNNSNNSSFNYSTTLNTNPSNNISLTDSPSPLKTLHKSILLDTSLSDDNYDRHSQINSINNNNNSFELSSPDLTTTVDNTTLNMSGENSLFVIDPVIYKYEFIKEICEWIIRLYYSSYEIFNKNILDYLFTILYDVFIYIYVYYIYSV